MTAAQAVSLVKPGDRVFVHGSAATPLTLLHALFDRARELRDVEIVSVSTLGDLGLDKPGVREAFFINSLFVSANVRQVVDTDRGDYVPVFLSEIPRLFDGGILPIDVALVHVSPPDRHGLCSLGVSVDVARAAVRSARTVIAQVNPHMPRTHGEGHVHVSRFAAMVDVTDALPEVDYRTQAGACELSIARRCAELIEDGSTLQMGIGAIPDAILGALEHHRDLGVHTEMCSNGIMPLLEKGVITNRFKKRHPGRVVASFAVGTRALYDLLDDNPTFAFLDAEYVNDGHVIRQNPKVVAVNSAIEMDLTGQVCADSIGTWQYSGVGGQMDFMRGAALSEGGKPIIAMASVTARGVSKIVPFLRLGASVVTTRAHVHWVVTEHGTAYLYGKNLRQRAEALIAVAHPDHRETLSRAAWERFGSKKRMPDLRDQLAALADAGLAADEAFFVAVKRMGSLDALSREFAREHSERLWKQLVIAPDAADAAPNSSPSEVLVVLSLALAAAVAVKVPELFGFHLGPEDEAPPFYFRNASLFVFPLLAVYFLWKRGWSARSAIWLALPFAAGAVFANVYPWQTAVVDNAPKVSDTQVLTMLHLPIALWLAVGFAYVRGRWFADGGRMNFVRFSGELAIYYVLIALGGGVLIAFTMMIFAAIDVNAARFAFPWLLPCGAAAAVIVGSWLVEAKQSVIENTAPVLARLFTPLFTVLLLMFLATMAWTGSPINVEREVLIGFDLLLAVVVALVLYATSARDPQAPPDLFDGLQLLLVVSALVVDGVALAAIAARISEFGFTPNRVAALGENLILLVNLAWSAWLYAGFLRRRGSFAALERWQVAYLPVYSAWAALVVVVFPPLFGYR